MAAMLTYVRAFISGDLEPFWPHVVLLSLAVLASIAVGAGIIFERPRYPPAVHRVAFWLVVAGIAIEAICTIFLFVFDEGISNSQQSKIITLERRLAPRHLSGDPKDKFIAQMKEFSGTKFVISTAGASEPETFAIEVADALKIAGWEWVNWPLGGIATQTPGGRPQMGLDLMSGIEAHIFDDSHKPLAIGLYLGLTAAGFKSQWVLVSPDARAPDIIIIIVIGSKE